MIGTLQGGRLDLTPVETLLTGATIEQYVDTQNLVGAILLLLTRIEYHAVLTALLLSAFSRALERRAKGIPNPWLDREEW